MSTAEKIQMVINTIGQIKVNATKENANRILGMYLTLEEVQKDLMNKEEEKHGNADTE